jgi:hypothetical protein
MIIDSKYESCEIKTTIKKQAAKGMGAFDCWKVLFMPVKIKIRNSPLEVIQVRVYRPMWREFLEY